MKKTLQFISTFLCAVLLFVSVPITTSAALPAEKDRNEVDIDEYNHSLSSLTQKNGYSIDELYHEEIDGVDYIYTVKNGEAYVLNIHLQHTGPNKIIVTLPTSLGGYPATHIGDPSNNVEVFWFIQYDEIIDWEECYDYMESSIYWNYVEKIIIPEGYEVIADRALAWAYGFEFPKSLKKIYGAPLEWLCFPTTVEPSTQRNLAVLPDCQYETENTTHFYDMFKDGNMVVLPSRDISFTKYMLRSDDAIGWHFYVPSNLSFEDIRDALFYTPLDDDSWDAKQGYGKVDYSTLHFAADSDIPEQIEALEGDNPYPMVCDLPVATHIAFDAENVTVEVGEVVDLEAKTYPAEAVWTACDYVSSNPEVVKVDPYSGRITALAEGEATITATHVERGFVDTCTVKVENKPEHICTPAEKWSADETAHWLECLDPECGEIINYAEHSGGNATVNAKAVCEHCGTAYGEYVAASFSVEPVSDIAYCAREKREYKITVAENADKVQFIRDSGSTTTFVRSQAAEIINNGDGTETWILAVSLNKGKYTLATKYGKVWNKNGIEFEIVFDTPKCRSFASEKVGNLTTFTVVTDPQVAKIQLITQSGNTLTYTQSNSYIGEDGLRYWTVVRKITKPGTIGLRTKYGYTWTTTDFTIEV